MTYTPAKFDGGMSKDEGGDAFTSKYIILTFDIDLRVKVTGNDVQYPLHYVTYAPVKF